MNEIKKKFIKMTCKSCNQVSVIECEETTDDEPNVTMGVQMECNSLSKPLSHKIPSPHKDCIKNALKRLKDQYSFGIPDKETINDN
tara:strand:- start:180 stop:437 length:258 start_codon:yes stop_codon:yes gene_type:complete